jgi:hypothetical protein
MHNKLSSVLILCMSTVCLSGCDLLRVTGPCYGVGCPGGTAGHNGQYKPGEASKAQNAAAPAPAKSDPAPNQSASAATQSNTALPNIVQPTAPAHPGSAQASNTQDVTPQPVPAQNASAETKPSPFHAIGEFFERLIPHHNRGANSGAGD